MNKVMKEEIQVLELLSISAMPIEGKQPIIKEWETADTASLFAKIKLGKNFGIRTGKVSDCIVVDIDTKDRGLETWTEIEKKMGKIDTYRVRTGSGGLHLYFEYAAGLKNGAKLVRVAGEKVGIDLKTDRGQVVAALSIHPDTKKVYEADIPIKEWYKRRTDAKKKLFERLPDWLRALLVGDAVLTADYEIIQAPKKVEPKQTPLEPLVNLGITMDFVEQLVMDCIKPSRADDSDDWLSICFGLCHASQQYKLKLKPLAHEFSKQSDKYQDKDGAKAIESLWKEEQPKDKALKTLGTVRHFAREDNPELYKELCQQITMPDDAPPTVWEDLPKIRCSKPSLVALMMYFRGCIFEVRNAGVQYFARMRSGRIVPIDTPFQKRGENPSIPLNNDKSIPLAEAFEGLQNMECWLKNTFDRVDIMPSFTERIEVPGVLNLFTGYACKPIEGSTKEVELVDWHIKNILCAGHEKFYQMLEFWLAHLVQFPGRKIEIMPLFLGQQGTGKSLTFDKLFPLLFGEEYCMEIDDMNELFERFNTEQEGKNICVLNEIGTYGKDHGQSGKLKSRLTRKRMAVEGKGKAKYTVLDFCNYLLLSNKANPVKIEISNRRYAPITVSDQKIGDRQYFIDLDKALNKDTICRLLHRWLHIDLSTWNKQEIPKTDALQYMADMSLESTARYMVDIASKQTDLLKDDVLKEFSSSLYNHYAVWCKDQGETPTPQKVFSSELIRMKVPNGNVTIDGERLKGFSCGLEELRKVLRVHLRDPNRCFDIAELAEL